MILIICDNITKKTKTINNPFFIPRKGDEIVWEYEPCPKVTKVIINYDKQEIYVSVN
jgi:hypothetical protein